MALNFNPPVGAKLNWSHPINRGLVGCWLFNEAGGQKFKDIAGVNDGTGVNSPTVATGQYGVGIKLSNSVANQYVSIGTNSSLNLSTDATILVFVNLVATTGIQWLGATGDNAGNVQFGFEVGRTANKIDTIWGTSGGGFDILTSTNTISAGKWYMLAVTRTGSGTSWSASLYINGVLDSTQAGVKAPSSFVAGYIGAFSNGGNQSGNLSLNGVRYYNRALSAQEIRQLYVQPFAGVNVKPWMSFASAATRLYGFVFG